MTTGQHCQVNIQSLNNDQIKKQESENESEYFRNYFRTE